MSRDLPTPRPKELEELAKQLSQAHQGTLDSLDAKGEGAGYSEKLVDAIEMIGEEKAAQLPPPGHSEVTPGMRYLHCSRTIHQLVTDRNRAVGIFMGVASLLLTASSIVLGARPTGDLIVPLDKIQKWCLPITFGTLTVLALFVAFLLIRTRIGLIYEVAKMNALLGLPVGRVQRIAPLSIFFIMQAIISMAGGVCGAVFSVFMMYLASHDPEHVVLLATVVGVALTAGLMILYIVTVNYTTADHRLQALWK